MARAYDDSFKQKYGPEVYALLQEAGNDPALAKKLGKLSDKELRKFALDTAFDVWEPGDAAPAGAAPAPVQDPRYDQLKGQVDEMVGERRRAEYERTRTTELQALVNSYPELRWERMDDKNGLRVQAIIEQAQKESMLEGKVVTFADVYTRMRRIEGDATPAPRIPSTSRMTAPNAQAPRTEAEARANMKATLTKHGGLSGLAASIASTRK